MVQALQMMVPAQNWLSHDRMVLAAVDGFYRDVCIMFWVFRLSNANKFHKMTIGAHLNNKPQPKQPKLLHDLLQSMHCAQGFLWSDLCIIWCKILCSVERCPCIIYIWCKLEMIFFNLDLELDFTQSYRKVLHLTALWVWPSFFVDGEITLIHLAPWRAQHLIY